MHLLEPLPLQLSPYEDESGTGYCLRAATANGLSLHWLRNVCGLGYRQMPTAANAPMLSGLFGCSEYWLSKALMTQTRGVAGYECTVKGQAILARNYLRGRGPQVCPVCVHESGYCRLAWDLSMYTVCAAHGVAMVDRCGHCHAPIRWDRPSIEICHCGWAISADAESTSPINRVAVALAEHIEDVLGEVSPHRASEWFRPFATALSLDGLFTVVLAFGIKATEHSVAASQRCTKSQSTRHWRQIVDRGIGRLQEFRSAHAVSGTVTSCVDEMSLRRLLKRSVLESDRLVACEILESTVGRIVDLHKNHPRQLELFSA